MNNTQKKLLIVEDDPTSRAFLKFMLKKIKLDYLEAETGEMALELMETDKVDGMLLDIALGEGISGVTLMEKFREMKKFIDIPIIAVTAFENRVVGKIENGGFNDILRKPYTLGQLQNVLMKHNLIIS